MANELLKALLSLTLASSAGILAVLTTRRPVRYVFGCSACYSLWLLVPVAMLAALLPHAGSPVSMTWSIESVSALRHALAPRSLAFGTSASPAPSIGWQVLVLGAWCIGAALFVAYLTLQQRAFVKSLGSLTGTRCVLRAARPEGCPVLLGVLRPKIVLPADFDSRYTRLERLLIFSHERTHFRRGDAGCNGLVALLRCIFWFNPLVHLASSYFRVDQEFACDAAVMRDYPASRRTYAGAMLKTQLADLALPIGCHWRSAEGLRERVRMLKRRMPSRGRRVCGGALTALLSLVVGCTTWVAQPPKTGPKPASAIVAVHPFAGPVDIDADEGYVAPGQSVMELQGNGRLVVHRGVLTRIFSDRMIGRDYAYILQGHVRMIFESAATGRAQPRTMTFETERATLTHQPDGSMVVRFDEGTVQPVPVARIFTSPLSFTAPETPHLVTPNFRNADLAHVAKAVGLATGRSFIIDPRAHAQITIISSSPMTPEAFYQAFLATLQAQGLAALPAVDSNGAVARRRSRDQAGTGQTGPTGQTGSPIVGPGETIWIVPAASAR